VAAGTTDGTILVLNAESGQVAFTLRGHLRTPDPTVVQMAFHPRSGQLASIGSDRALKVWDATRSQEADTFTLGPVPGITLLGTPSHGRRVIFGGFEGQIHCWDVDRRQKERIIQLEKAGPLTFAAEIGGGTRLVVVEDGAGWRVWDVAAKRQLLARPGKPGVVVPHFAAVSPDGAWLAIAIASGNTRRLAVWNTKTGEERSGLARPAAGGLAFSPDGRLLAVNGWGRLTVLDVATGTEQFRRSEAASHFGRVAFSPDGSRLASTADNGVVHVWDVTTGKSVSVIRGDVEATGLAFTPDGSRLAVLGTGRVNLWEPASGQLALTVKVPPMLAAMERITFSEDGRRLLGFAQMGNVTVWDATPVR
jgi:WD40 repeat protein